jgi:hypothetical protein
MAANHISGSSFIIRGKRTIYIQLDLHPYQHDRTLDESLGDSVALNNEWRSGLLIYWSPVQTQQLHTTKVFPLFSIGSDFFLSLTWIIQHDRSSSFYSTLEVCLVLQKQFHNISVRGNKWYQIALETAWQYPRYFLLYFLVHTISEYIWYIYI